MNDINELTNLFEKISIIKEEVKKLSWDLYTKKINNKDEVIKKITEGNNKLFKIYTSQEYYNIITKKYDISSLEQKYLNRLIRKYEKEKNVPSDLYDKYIKNKIQARLKWEEAREQKDFTIFKPYLKNNIDLTKEICSYHNDCFDNIYDDLLDDYSEGITTKILDSLFENIKKELIPQIKKLNKEKIKYTPKLNDNQIINASEYLLNYLGFDLNRGEIGLSASAFTTTVNKDDHRIAIDRSKTAGIAFTSIIHEGGHGIFEQNVNSNLTKYKNYYIDNYALHESQSRFFENIIGRNKNFWLPIIDELNNRIGINIDVNDLIKELNYIYPNYIRCDSDELTYTMHIIIRYEIERDLFLNKIDIEDLEKIWNKKTKEYLGLEVENPSDGILQDVHWSEANFGYFPMYLVGSIFDGIILESINKELGDINNLLKNKEISKITEYLKNKIYKYGGEYTIVELCNKVFNKELSSAPIIDYYLNLIKK